MKKKPHKKINLALQGGGAHGAFTWGVLDRLLEEEDIEIEGISGTSAGAMNAAVMLSGWCSNGREGAKDALESFWRDISRLGQLINPAQKSEQYGQKWNLDWSLSYNFFDLVTRFFSPYEFNPLNINPLREVLEKTLDIDSIRQSEAAKIFVTATCVKSGQPRVFKRHEMSVDAILASACIPLIFQAVEIDGQPYWDGGYMGNPVIWPLIYHTDSSDVLLVQINPIYRDETPMRAYEIVNRLNEITFNSSLIAEMRAINFVKKLIREDRLDRNKYKDVRMHVITTDVKSGLDASSKMNVTWEFFQYLKKTGYAACEEWLKTNKRYIGKRSSVDITQQFLHKPTITERKQLHAKALKAKRKVAKAKAS